ncbi:MAG: tRNA lysidine(34) synthetase TilS, partial [Chloroflexota bacterium]
YAFFERAAAAAGADRVALGHNADDQAETIIMRLLRGAGSEGLAGIPPVRLPYIRPLIETTRSVIEAYCQANGLHPRYDATNADPAYLRNRIRHGLMPLLKEYNPRLVPALSELGDRLRAEADYIDKQAEAALASCGTDGALDCACLLALPVALQRATLRAYYRRETGAEPLGYHHVERMRELVAAGRAGHQQLPGGFSARCERGLLRIVRAAEAFPAFAVKPAIPGLTALPTGETLAAWLTEPARFDWSTVNAGRQAFLDAAGCQGGIVIRNRRLGDRIRLPGVGGLTKLQDVLVDAKVPRWERDRLPLLARDDEVLWIPGLRVSESVQVTGRTRQVLALQLMERPDCCCCQ